MDVFSLLDLAETISNNPAPLAYGGKIFNTVPALRDHIPGYFLGTDLRNAIFNIEQLLHNPPKKHIPKNYGESPLLKKFRAALPKIESRFYELIQENPRMRSAPVGYFSRDILAALRLGETTLLNSNLIWVSGLLSNKQIPNEVLLEVLNIYLQAVVDMLGSDAEPIQTWLQNEIHVLVDHGTGAEQ